MHEQKPSIRQTPTIAKLLDKMPSDVANSFNDEQLTHIMTAIGTREWGKHSIDKRGTFKIPFYQFRFYYVVLFGKNHRELSRSEKNISLFTMTIFTSLFLIFSAMIGILVLYLIKSALGIDLIPGFSFGVWGWFKELW